MTPEIVFDPLRLERWFSKEGILYPWSETRDAYAVWVSEVMLQQTVVTAAVEHYKAWMERWPSIRQLALATQEQVLRAWEGLGYYSRAKNLHAAAKKLVQMGYTNLPPDEALINSLPGVGSYTAAAVLSFAYGQSALPLDANLKRVFQRLADQIDWNKEFETQLRGVMKVLFAHYPSREVNLSLMQLGQLVCTPRDPNCLVCPLACDCLAKLRGTQNLIPRKLIRTVVDKTTFMGVYIRRKNNVLEFYLGHPEKGRFSNLWAFIPLSQEPDNGSPLTPRVHSYTKYKDSLLPFLIIDQDPSLPQSWTGQWVSVSQAEALALPSVHRKIYLEALKSLE
jgi:A/G-specific adenine glycosylase